MGRKRRRSWYRDRKLSAQAERGRAQALLPLVGFARDVTELERIANSGISKAEVELVVGQYGPQRRVAQYGLNALLEGMKLRFDATLAQYQTAQPQRVISDIVARSGLDEGQGVRMLEAALGDNGALNLEIALATKGRALDAENAEQVYGRREAREIVREAQLAVAERETRGSPLVISTRGQNGLQKRQSFIPSDVIAQLFTEILRDHFEQNYRERNGESVAAAYEKKPERYRLVAGSNENGDGERRENKSIRYSPKRNILNPLVAAGIALIVGYLGSNGRQNGRIDDVGRYGRVQQSTTAYIKNEKETEQDNEIPADNKIMPIDRSNNDINPTKNDTQPTEKKEEKNQELKQEEKNGSDVKESDVEIIIKETYKAEVRKQSVVVSPYEKTTKVQFGYNSETIGYMEEEQFRKVFTAMVSESYNYFKEKYGKDLPDFKENLKLTINWESRTSPDGSSDHNKVLAKERELATEELVYKTLRELGFEEGDVKITRSNKSEVLDDEDRKLLTGRANALIITLDEYIERHNERGQLRYRSNPDEAQFCQNILGKSRISSIDIIRFDYHGQHNPPTEDSKSN